jgi:Leucine-rich repeat (LRR) protein
MLEEEERSSLSPLRTTTTTHTTTSTTSTPRQRSRIPRRSPPRPASTCSSSSRSPSRRCRPEAEADAAAPLPERTTTPAAAIRTPTPTSTPTSTPTHTHTRTSQHTTNWRTRMGLETSIEDQAEQLARRLQHATEVLLEKLFGYLSTLPEETDDGSTTPVTGGMTLPASAVGWLSNQLYPPSSTSSWSEEDELCATTLFLGANLRDRLALLRFLLPRVTHVRLTRQVWPPELPKASAQRQQQQQRRGRRRTRHQPPNTHIHTHHQYQYHHRPRTPPEEVLNCSTLSVSSALTMEDYTTNGHGTAPIIHPPPTRQAFYRYMQGLQDHPRIDLRVFPKVQVLVLESIPPPWIRHLSSVQASLQVLRWNRACVYHELPRLFYPTITTTSTSTPTSTKAPSRQQATTQPQSLLPHDDPLATPSTTTYPSHYYSKLTHLNFDHCGIGELSGLSRLVPTLTQVQCLSLAHNEICSERTALKGLRHLTHLTRLNLSHNQLGPQLPNANRYLGGQLQRLQLSHNRISSTRGGLDRLYALEELWLDYNAITDLGDISGLARLPQLRRLYLRGNPIGRGAAAAGGPTKGGHSSSSSQQPQYPSQQYRLPVLTWFHQERRATRPDELPLLDGLLPVTTDEWAQLQANSFVPAIMTNQYGRPVEESSSSSSRQTTPAAAFTSTTACIRSLTTPCRNRPVQRKRKTHKATIATTRLSTWQPPEEPAAAAAARLTPKHAPQTTPKKALLRVLSKKNPTPRSVAFSVQDVLLSLHKPAETMVKEEVVASIIRLSITPEKEETPKEVEEEEPGPVQVLRDHDVQEDYHLNLESVPMTTTTTLDTTMRTPYDEAPVKLGSTISDVVQSRSSTSNERPTNGPVPHSEPTRADEPCEGDAVERENSPLTNVEPSGFTTTMEATTILPLEEPSSEDPAIEDASTENGSKQANDDDSAIKVGLPQSSSKPKGKVATIKLQTGATRQFDIFSTDWDELVRQAAEGLIPNGKFSTPVVALKQTSKNLKESAVFSPHAVDLLAPSTTNELVSAQQLDTSIQASAANTIDDSGPSSLGFRSNALPEHVFQDDFSLPSSLGTSRDDFPRTSKFQLAEDNAIYDGPDGCRDMNVLKNLDLYFNTFVFPSSLCAPSEENMEELEEDWQMVAMRYPRIQLWPEDRRRLENNISSPSTDIDNWSSNRERFVRVWDEAVIPCGKPALRRLAPNRQTRLGFHGDQLYIDGTPDPYAEDRKVFLCLSSSAFYILLCQDAVTTKKQEAKGIKKKFPNPIGDDSTFQNAPWPHAVARHSFQELQSIKIGFEFQRLTLQFSNPSVRRTEPFVYVLLTSNKKETVRVLQEIQRLAKEANEHTTDLVSDATAIAIENDSQVVFDALAVAVAPDLVGTILHYQIVAQRWKHGEGRGTVRRVCVVTDTKMFLLDEDYNSDGHNALESTHLADVSYRIIDEATLKQVAEVQPAAADPTAITIVINPLSRLSRTHRWRLLCRDSAGAERLVDDVRKALDQAED